MKNWHIKTYILRIFILSWGLFSPLVAQKLNIKQKLSAKNPLKGKGLKITGAINSQHVYYHSFGLNTRTTPFNMLYSGNMNIDILGKIQMPFMFSFSNQNSNFQVNNPFKKSPIEDLQRFRQPFNRFVLKPSYKGWKLQVGTAVLNFSPYTLSTHRYNGIGLEYKPEKKPYYMGLMFGNLKKAVRIDSSFETKNNIPSYQRSGRGLMLGYKKDKDKAEVIFFTATDRPTSLPYRLDERNIFPTQNSVISLKGSKGLYKNWEFDGEFALSGITSDMRSDLFRKTNFLNSFFGTLQPKASTEYRKALKADINYKSEKYQAGVGYSRIDPNYRTLGAYYFLQDIETFSSKATAKFLDNKMTISGQLGWQQDNVEKQKIKTIRRLVGAGNLKYSPSEKLKIDVNYSTFTSYSNMRSELDYLRQITPYNALDTLDFRQINQNVVATFDWELPNSTKEKQQNITFNAMIQGGQDQGSSQTTANQLNNLNIGYQLNTPAQKQSLSISGIYSYTLMNGQRSYQMGPVLGFNRGIGEKLKLSSNLNYTQGKMNDNTDRVLNARLGLIGEIAPKLNLNFSLIYLNRYVNNPQRFVPPTEEITATLGLNYNFSLVDLKIK